MLTEQQKLKYYKNKALAKEIILQDASVDKHVIYGEQAVKAHLPSHLHRYTEDYDIFAKNPKAEAKQMEKKLDKIYGGNYFRTKKGAHKGTHKVISNVTNKTVVDYTKEPKKLNSVQIGGNLFVGINAIKKQLKKTLKDEASSFRHDKDFETLQRIKLGEKGLGW